MPYAVVQTGGKQHRVEKGSRLRVEKLAGAVGDEVTLSDVRMIGGDEVAVGAPTVLGAQVTAKIVEHGRGKKLIVFKLERRKNYRRKNGHRQPYTEIEVTGIRTGKKK